MDFRYVLMDVDGVIVPGPGSRFAHHLAAQYGLTDTATKSFFRGPFQQCLVGMADLRVELPPYLAQWEWPGHVDDFLAVWFRCEHIVYDEVLAVMDRLRQAGVGVYLATNQEAYRTRYLQERMGLTDHVDGVFASCMVGHLKPVPEYFASILGSLGARPESVLLWDDSERIVSAARSLGLHAELFEGPTAFVDKMSGYFPPSQRHNPGARRK